MKYLIIRTHILGLSRLLFDIIIKIFVIFVNMLKFLSNYLLPALIKFYLYSNIVEDSPFSSKSNEQVTSKYYFSLRFTII